MPRVALALVHHPIVDRSGAVITAAITNIDLHDLARTACTYGATDLFVIHPIAAQRELAERVRTHWVNGAGTRRIPSRGPAMQLVRIVNNLEEAYGQLGGRESVEVYTTTARQSGRAVSTFAEARARLGTTPRSALIVFGTGWGLADSVIESSDVLLEPILGANESGYNHLSVRAACAIILDRLLAPGRP